VARRQEVFWLPTFCKVGDVVGEGEEVEVCATTAPRTLVLPWERTWE